MLITAEQTRSTASTVLDVHTAPDLVRESLHRQSTPTGLGRLPHHHPLPPLSVHSASPPDSSAASQSSPGDEIDRMQAILDGVKMRE